MSVHPHLKNKVVTCGLAGAFKEWSRLTGMILIWLSAQISAELHGPNPPAAFAPRGSATLSYDWNLFSNFRLRLESLHRKGGTVAVRTYRWRGGSTRRRRRSCSSEECTPRSCGGAAGSPAATRA